jgi:hypothetical protein
VQPRDGGGGNAKKSLGNPVSLAVKANPLR